MEKKSGLIAEALRANQKHEQQLAADEAKRKREWDERYREAKRIEDNALRHWIESAFGIAVNNTDNPCCVDGVWIERVGLSWEESDEGYRSTKSESAYFLLWDCPKCGQKRRALSFPGVHSWDKNKSQYQTYCKRFLGQYVQSVTDGEAEFAGQCQNCKDGKDEWPSYSCRLLDLDVLRSLQEQFDAKKTIVSSENATEKTSGFVPHNCERQNDLKEGSVSWTTVFLAIVGTLIVAYFLFMR